MGWCVRSGYLVIRVSVAVVKEKKEGERDEGEPFRGQKFTRFNYETRS